VSDSNKFVLIRSEGRGSVGKQLVLRTASTHKRTGRYFTGGAEKICPENNSLPLK